jgi:hypothetical protein
MFPLRRHFCAASLTVLLAACASNNTPPLPMVHNPVTYQVPLGGPSVPHIGDPHLEVGASQDVSVQPGKPLFFEIRSPVDVTVYLYEKVGAAPNANLLRHMEVHAGTPVSAHIVPPSSSIEFLFSNHGANPNGTLQFTLSDQPLAGGPAHSPATFVGE